MTVVTVTNRKGGVGKTTLSNHLAAGLATVGYRVGLVDTDSQGHSASTLQMQREDGLYNLLVNKAPVEDVLREVPKEHYSTEDYPAKGALYLLPSADLTHKVPYELDQSDAFAFLEAADKMRRAFKLNLVLVDTNPTLTALDSYVYMATDAYVYVTETERLSSEAVDRAIQQMRRFAAQRKQYLRRNSTILGVLPNKVRPNTSAHQVAYEELVKVYGKLVWEPVPLRTVWAEASLVGQMVYNYAPGSKASQDAWRMVRTAVDRLRKWQEANRS